MTKESSETTVVKAPVRISSEEWMRISVALEPHHAVFYKVWQMGKPVFDESIPTACVQFDQNGNFILFRFNPEFWQKLDFTSKLWVICHEALHIVLNHGIRARDAGINSKATNMAMDIVVNHSLSNNFGFNREEILNWQDYCWVDTVFKDKDPLPPDNEQFEYYYNLFDKIYGDGGPGDGSEGSGPQTVDDHSGMGEQSGDWSKVIDKLNESMTGEEKSSIKNVVEKHFQKPEEDKESKTESSDKQAGTGTGSWTYVTVVPKKKKSKWETVIKKWSKRYLIHMDKDTEQWARLNRRLTMLPRDMILPSEMEVDDLHQDKSRIDVWFYLDTSGSCWDLKDRFFTAASTLPPERFNVRLFCFDTQVQETTLESKKVYGGGGTCFRIIENQIQGTIQKEGCRYPAAVFLITDGYGTTVTPQFPDRWHWFLSEGGSKHYLPKESHVYELKDYE